MSPRRNPIRYAHSEGHTDVCYAEDGSHILTCGQDGDVRIWAGLDDDDSTSQCVGEKAIAVAHKADHFYVGTDNNNVQAYTFPDANRDQIIARFSAPVTHIVVSYSGKKIVAGSCDMEIKIFDLETSRSQVLTGHSAPILGVSIDPKEKYVVSSSCDGTIRAWDLETLKSVNTWNCLKPCNSFFLAESLGRTSWQPPAGRHLAVPEGTEVILYERGNWEKVVSLTNDQIKKLFTIVSFSACGTYIAAATIAGEICVWNVNNHSCIMYVKHEQNVTICGLVWNPSGNGELAYCDVNGQLGTIEECIPQVPVKVRVKLPYGTRAVYKQTEDEDKVMTTLQMPAFDNEDEDDENVFSLEKIKASVPMPGLHEDVLDTDLEAHSIAGLEDDTESKIGVVPKQEVLCDIQPPFQPTSSPVHLQHRYMVWNSVGIIRSYDTEEENSIDIEFHDISTHHAIHMSNFLKHTMAVLSDEAAVLACEANEDMPSKLVCILLSAWDGSKEWSVDLPDGEEILALSVGQGWIAMATDTRNLRLFTVGGTQREVLSLPGPIVCLNGHKNKLLVIYHNGTGLGFTVLSVSTGSLNTITSFQPLPLAPQTSLHWAGFSDEGSACTVDSSGMVRILSPRGYWQPICDTKCPGKSDHYFILGISERYQTVRGILCRGSRYPPTTPRPTVAEIPIKLPLCEPITEKSELEELYWHSRLSFTSLDSLSKMEPSYVGDRDTAEKTIKETIIKLFALACRSGLEHRALELSGLMPSQQVVQLAVKYASKLGKRQLAERLTDEGTQHTEDFEDVNLQSLRSQPRYAWDDPRRPVILQDRAAWSNTHNNASGDYDPFTSSQDTQSNEQGNILLAVSERKTVPVIRPSLPLSNKKSNPFKKSSEQIQIGKGLTNMTSSFMSRQNMKNREVNVQSHTVSKAKESKIASKSSMPSDIGKKGTLSFIQWFSQEKPALQEEFPDMSSSELTREAMKRYKEVSQKQKMQHNSSPDMGSRNIQPATNIGANNSDIQVVESGTNKQGKFLVWFNKEKTALQEEFPELTPQQLTSEALKRYREAMQNQGVMSMELTSETTEPNEGKKRKVESTDFSNAENVSKKSHTDLLKFSFKK